MALSGAGGVADSELAHVTIKRSAENHEDNRLAYIKALRSLLRLQEVYGIADVVTADSGARVDLFRALLSLELMSAFFQRDMLLAFARHEAETGNCLAALTRLTFGGVVEGMQNRFPLTWSDRQAKVEDIVGWTVSAERPGGDPLMAAAILDFWTRDLHEWATRLQLAEELQPELHERPVLKMGSQLVQLPWLVGLQNNSTAAINNLRRLGARRESSRLKLRASGGPGPGCSKCGVPCCAQLASAAGHGGRPRRGGYRLCPGWLGLRHRAQVHFPASEPEGCLASRHEHVAQGWSRPGGRKVEAVRRALGEGLSFAPCWAARVSRHCCTVGSLIRPSRPIISVSVVFLKLSLEELLIALRDDRHLLNDPGDILAGASVTGEGTLYPHGFSAMRLLEVIEREEVWALTLSDATRDLLPHVGARA